MKRHLSPAVLPNCNLKRVVLHWTVGNHKPSSVDRAHYHFIIAGDLRIVPGVHGVKANALPFSRWRPYAAHALNFNAGSVGVALAGMRGCQERPFKPGDQPITREQWHVAAEVVAQICAQYNIRVTYKTVLQHGEIQANCGVRQRGKWDCMVLPWNPTLTPRQVARDFRLLVGANLKEMKRFDLVPF